MIHPLRSFLIILGLAIGVAGSAAAADKTIASGTWAKKSKKASGAWSIVEKDGKRVLQLDEKFKTSKAPDLKIVFSPHSAEAASNKNALEGGRVLSLLKSAKGAQKYELPTDLDPGQYKSVLIHCEKYTKLWVAGSLTHK